LLRAERQTASRLAKDARLKKVLKKGFDVWQRKIPSVAKAAR
jgi:hypothetical protein